MILVTCISLFRMARMMKGQEQFGRKIKAPQGDEATKRMTNTTRIPVSQNKDLNVPNVSYTFL